MANFKTNLPKGFNIWNGKADTSWYNESHTKFTLTNAEELAGLAELVNGGNNFSGKIIYLGGDDNIIAINDDFGWVNWSKNAKPKNEWRPIGNSFKTPFKGTFGGNGKIISGLYINAKANNLGLFGYVGKGGIIKNLGIVNSYINGKEHIGTLIGNNNGKINQCYAVCTVEGYNCIGGLVGTNKGEINQCYARGNISAENCSVGCLVGQSGDDYSNAKIVISESYAIGNVYGGNDVGGFVGRLVGCLKYNTIIKNCYSVGKVEKSTNTNDIGGFAGFCCFSTVGENFYNKEVSKQSKWVGKGSEDNEDGAEGKTTAQMKDKGTYTSKGWDFNAVWDIKNEINNGYPHLRKQQPSSEDKK